MKVDKETEVLALYPWPLRPDQAAGERRFAEILRAAERTSHVDLFMAGVDRAEAEFVRNLGLYFKGDVILDRGRGIASPVRHRLYHCCLTAFWTFAERAIPCLRRAAPWAPIIVDTVDIHFSRERAAVDLGLMSAVTAEANKARELAVYRAADALIVASEADRLALTTAEVATPKYVIPIIVKEQIRTRRERNPELLFIGGFNHPPNADGLSWFVRECWPVIRRQVDKAELTVVGSNPTDEVLALGETPGVKVVGYARNTEPYLDRAAVSIAPLRFGAGMKGKVCEALAAGVPLVTTTVGIQGLPLADYKGARVQDEAPDFAAAVIWALRHRDEAEALGAQGRSIVSLICGPETASRRVREMIHNVSKIPRPLERVGWHSRRLVSQFVTAGRCAAIACGAKTLKRVFLKHSPKHGRPRV